MQQLHNILIGSLYALGIVAIWSLIYSIIISTVNAKSNKSSPLEKTGGNDYD